MHAYIIIIVWLFAVLWSQKNSKLFLCLHLYQIMRYVVCVAGSRVIVGQALGLNVNALTGFQFSKYLYYSNHNKTLCWQLFSIFVNINENEFQIPVFIVSLVNTCITHCQRNESLPSMHLALRKCWRKDLTPNIFNIVAISNFLVHI